MPLQQTFSQKVDQSCPRPESIAPYCSLAFTYRAATDDSMEILDQDSVLGYLVQHDRDISEPRIHNEIVQLVGNGIHLHFFILQPSSDSTTLNHAIQRATPITYIPQLGYQSELINSVKRDVARQDVIKQDVMRQDVTMAYWYWLSHAPKLYWQALQLYHRRSLEWENFLQAMYLAQELHRHSIQHLRVKLPEVPIGIIEIAQQFHPFSWTGLD